MADCPERARTDALARGALEGEAKAEAESHVDGCADCRDVLQATLAEHTMTGGGPSAPPSGSGGGLPSIPDYRIQEILSKGGQGTVYKAVQRGTNRLVALKVLREGALATERERRRFEREVELVAELDHPNIVTVYDSGESEGRLWFAMQLVRGEPLDQYITGRGLRRRESLELFLRIAAAVQHAHQRGILHRDLKPANILVEETGRPVIVDFGLARMAAPAPGTAPELTVAGEILGTLAYTAPEQVGAEGAVDARADVYSLGVVLYEILAGRLPYELGGSLVEMVETIREARPLPPSRIDPTIDRDLETILLEALAKEPDRRYPTVEAMARDIERYLEGDPIDARRDSGLYVLRKTLRRHRIPVTAAAGFVLLLAAFAVAVSILARRLAIERDRAEEARKTEIVLRERAEWESSRANLAAAQASLEAGELAEARRRLAAVPVGLRGWEWRYLLGRTEQSVAVLGNLGHPVTLLAHSGPWLAAASPDREVSLWDLRSRISVARWSWQGMDLTALAMEPEGRRILVGDARGTVTLLDSEASGDPIPTSIEIEGPVADLDWRPPGGGILVLSPSGALDMRSLEDPEWGHRFPGLGETARFAVLGGGWHAAVGREGRIHLLHDLEGIRLGSWEAGGEEVTALAADRSGGDFLVTGSADDIVRLRGVRGNREYQRDFQGHEAAITAVAIRGDRIASGDLDGILRLWNLDGTPRATLTGHEPGIRAIEVLEPGAAEDLRVVTSDEAGTLRVWNDRPRGTWKWQLFSEPITTLSLGERDEGPIQVAVRASKPPIDHPGKQGFGDVVLYFDAQGSGGRVAVDPAGDRLARIEGDRVLVDGRISISIPSARVLAWSPSGEALAVGDAAGQLHLLDIETARSTSTRAAHEGAVRAIAWYPRPDRIVTGGEDGVVHLWDVEGPRPSASLPGAGGAILSLDVDPEGRLVAIGTDDPVVRVWNPESGRPPIRLEGHARAVSSVGFLPSGHRLASASLGRTVRLWDTDRFEVAFVLQAAWAVHSLGVTPDGRVLLAGLADGSVRAWEAPAWTEEAKP